MVVRKVKAISAGTEGVFFWLLFISVTLYKEFFFLFACRRRFFLSTLSLKAFVRPCKKKTKTSCECVKRGSELVNNFFFVLQICSVDKKVINVQKSKKIKVRVVFSAKCAKKNLPKFPVKDDSVVLKVYRVQRTTGFHGVWSVKKPKPKWHMSPDILPYVASSLAS